MPAFPVLLYKQNTQKLKIMKSMYLIPLLFALLFSACGNNSETSKSDIANNMANVNSGDKTIKDNKLKRYKVKSGIVKYDIKINGKVMGSTVTGSGTEELYFKDWGDVELKKQDSKQVTKINIFGQKKTEVQETHVIDKLDNGKSYHVDIKNKTIFLRRDPAMEMMKTYNDGDVVDPGKKMLESIGGKIVGKEKVLGYTCDVWEIPGGKQWMYKGLPLKLVMTVMGITTSNTAVSAKFNTNVPDSYFKLPDYPIQKEDGYLNDNAYAKDKAEMKKNAKMMNNLTFEQYKEMLKKDNPEKFKNMSDEELKIGYQMMKKVAQKMSH